MPQNSEQIEAKLCAFLEGELDEQGLADIERHLQSNPAHRKLLAEVGKTRGLLRALPRESAPPDICDAFQGQLERSVLLADLDDDGGQSATKASRWPQYLAVAAVVMLAAGLGTIVYFGLPSGGSGDRFVVVPASPGRNSNPDGAATLPTAVTTVTVRSSEGSANELTVSSSPPAPPMVGSVTVATTSRAEEIESGRPAMRGIRAEKAMELTFDAQPPASAPSAPAQDLTVLAKRVQGSWETRERELLFTSDATDETTRVLASVPAGATYLVFACAEPTVAADRIGRELGKFRVAWSVLPNPDPAAVQRKLDSKGAIDGPKDLAVPNQNTMRGVGEVEQPTTRALGPREAPSLEAAVALRDGERSVDRGAVDESRPAPMPDRWDDSDADAVSLPEANAPVASARGPATRPAGESPDPVAIEPGLVLTDSVMRPIRDAKGEPITRPETLIVARGLTREQADALRASLEVPGLEPRIRLQSADVPSDLRSSGDGGGTEATPGAAGNLGVGGYGLGAEAAAGAGRRTSTGEPAVLAPSRTTAYADGVPQGDEKVDLVIVVRGEGLDAGGVPQPQTTAAEPDGPIEKFDILTIQVGDAEADSANVRVAEDGTVDVSRVGRLKAEGLTSSELEKEIVWKRKEATTTGQPDGQVTVRRMGTEATATTSPAGSARPPAQPSSDGDPGPSSAGAPK